MLFASDFRRIAREALVNRWGLAIGTGFVAGLLGVEGGANLPNYEWRETENFAHAEYGLYSLLLIFGLLGIGMLFALVAFFFGGAVKLGYCRFNRNLLDHNNPQFTDLFSRFDIFWRAFGMQFLIGLYTFLWSLLLIIPGIIAAYSYAMAPYILEENPYMPINEAIGRSKEMMYGNRWRLFCLGFSFIGWGLLSILTCGIGLFWLTPYMNASYAAFYYDVSGKYRTQGIPPQYQANWQ
jgi:uncharacterized membrane protein